MPLLGQPFLHPDQEQTIADLETATGIPQQTLSREVNRQLAAGLLEGRRVGRLDLVHSRASWSVAEATKAAEEALLALQVDSRRSEPNGTPIAPHPRLERRR
jgi:hypothetical protein